MWVFTNQGFISVVASENSPSYYMIQSQFPQHIESFFPEAHVHEKPGGTYRLRTSIQKHVVSQRLHSIIEGITYTDFKNSIPDPHYLAICRDVWATLDKYTLHPSDPPKPDWIDKIIP